MNYLIGVFILLLASQNLNAQYNSYSSNGNLYARNVIETKDGGYLVASNESCYTAGIFVPDGCPYALHIVKTNAIGDTLWTNTIDHPSIYNDLFLFENENGGFTIFSMIVGPQGCDYGLGGVFTQIQIFTLNSIGELINKIQFPDNCELRLVDVLRNDDNSFAVLSYFSNLVPNETEGRLSIINNLGNITNEVYFPLERFRKGQLIRVDISKFKLFYFNSESELTLNTYDSELNLLQHQVQSNLENFCYWSHFMNATIFNNGDLGINCHKLYQDFENTHFKRFTIDLDISVEKKYTLNHPTNIIENSNGEILMASATTSSNSNTQINYFSSTGDSIRSTIINQLGDQEPHELIKNSNDQLVILGSVNCCNNADTLIGPSTTFLQLDNHSTSTHTIEYHNDITLFPNPCYSYFKIAIENIDQPLKFSLYSTLGGHLLQERIDKNSTIITLNNDYPEGIYFFTIESFNGKEILKSGKILNYKN